MQFVDGASGQPGIVGRYASGWQSTMMQTRPDVEGTLYLMRDDRGPSLQDRCPEVIEELLRFGDICRKRLREEMQIKFTLQNGALCILDAIPVQRSSRAAVRIAVDLAGDQVIPREEAVMRIKPTALSELLHSQVDPSAARDVLVRGI